MTLSFFQMKADSATIGKPTTLLGDKMTFGAR